MAWDGKGCKYQPDSFPERAYTYLSEGHSIVELARELGCTRDAIYKWERDHEVFARALEMGREHSQAYWEGELVTMMYNKDINSPLVKLYFANRFKWHDRPTEEQEQKEPQIARIEVVTVGANTSD